MSFTKLNHHHHHLHHHHNGGGVITAPTALNINAGTAQAVSKLMHFPNVVGTTINSPANSTCSSSNENTVSTNSRLSSSSSSATSSSSLQPQQIKQQQSNSEILNAVAAAAAYSRLPQLQDFQSTNLQNSQQPPTNNYPVPDPSIFAQFTVRFHRFLVNFFL